MVEFHRGGPTSLPAQAAAALVRLDALAEVLDPQGCLALHLLLAPGPAVVVVDVVVVDVLGALPADQGLTGAQGWGGTGGPRRGQQGTEHRRPVEDQGAPPALGGAGAGRAAQDGGGLAPGRLKHTGQVLIQDGLGVIFGQAREEGQGVGGEAGGLC